ncbi:PREDICTED: protein NRT1/ PTR FAMILY 1.1-like [Lupinus angustifolius]|uniref:protein NRT1/ PTR FAMILY 1.1-like n=1 Tax=Lupinus angustifolius TaxID=3871 RepID=UPI00092FBCF9|nr:PREDICTED: protein NRT1/ PTR FAMILY 1.1-like [Lupinus angustifolius]
MEISKDQDKATEKVTKKGGFKTLPFIIANESFEKVANLGLHVNMILYLLYEYHFDPSTAAIILFLWFAASNFMPFFGAFLSDSCLGRFRVIAWGSVVALLICISGISLLLVLSSLQGLVFLWLTAFIPQARPPHCKLHEEPCASPTGLQILFLCCSLALMAFGAGGVRPCSLAFGADQINNPENPQNERILKSFFNWYYVSVGLSIMISMVFIVYIQVKAGWVVGFAVPVGLMSFSAIIFFLGSFMYIKVKPNKSLLTGFAQVIVAAWRNRHLPLPPKNSDTWFSQDGSNLLKPTDKARFLNKACIIKNREKDLDSNGMPIEPWSLCTVRKVEEMKAVVKVLPIWSTNIIFAMIINQHSFSAVQAGTMDRHVFNLEMPATSFSAFIFISLFLWVAIYDRILLPLISKYTKVEQGRGITLKKRIGTGLLLSCLAPAIAVLVERKRRDAAISEGLINNPKGVVNMSAMWLLPQHGLTGLAEGLTCVGQIELYYSQFPKTMSSIAVGLFYLGFGTGNLLASLIVKIVNDETKRGGKVSWLSSNLNQGHYDYYYALLSILSLVNLLWYILCSSAYGSLEDITTWDEDVGRELEQEKEKETTQKEEENK